MANISTRVPSLQFKRPSLDPLVISNLATPDSENNMIKLVMAPGDRQFITSDYKQNLSSVTDYTTYIPRVSCLCFSKKFWKFDYLVQNI